MHVVPVQTKCSSYPIYVGTELPAAKDVKTALAEHVEGESCLVVTDSHVGPLYGQKICDLLCHIGAARVAHTTFPAGEPSKTLATVERLYRAALEKGLDRQSLFIALGGGVVGDVAGFAAATYMRGIRFLQIPSTLLAMVDSSVGGKTGVDLPEGKNLVGAFHQPTFVMADVSMLKTLPIRELRCGLAEVVKYGVIMDAEFFAFLQQHVTLLCKPDLAFYEEVVTRCCKLKARVVREDERECTGYRAILNYGHTFGHALEVLSGYGQLTHGEAVAVGMGMAADLAVQQGLADPSLVEQQDKLLAKVGLPTEFMLSSITSADIFETMRHDKKVSGGRLRLVLPTAIGSVELRSDIDPDAVQHTIGGRCGKS
ncbi:MAG: 3-dehydroquinate synthase [Candidatus Pacebacteria bacterium]|nr:3-dehydroquinate synthase [Candidatus Paceibacterota bacterium]